MGWVCASQTQSGSCSTVFLFLKLCFRKRQRTQPQGAAIGQRQRHRDPGSRERSAGRKRTELGQHNQVGAPASSPASQRPGRLPPPACGRTAGQCTPRRLRLAARTTALPASRRARVRRLRHERSGTRAHHVIRRGWPRGAAPRPGGSGGQATGLPLPPGQAPGLDQGQEHPATGSHHLLPGNFSDVSAHERRLATHRTSSVVSCLQRPAGRRPSRP